MRFSTFGVIALFGMLAEADYCRYRIRSYDRQDCNDKVLNDAYLSSRDCFDLRTGYYIWIDSLNGTDYCTQGNWIREYKNILHEGSCSNNNRGQMNVAMQTCVRMANVDTDSIRINYA